MLRGYTIFICDDCHKVFIGPDIEWNCTVLSVPMACPCCGSRHTYTSLLNRRMYRSLWEYQDRQEAKGGAE